MNLKDHIFIFRSDNDLDHLVPILNLLLSNTNDNEINLFSRDPLRDFSNDFRIKYLKEKSNVLLTDLIIFNESWFKVLIIKSLRKADSYSGPLLIWIMAKITNHASIASKHKNPQTYLKNNGVWQSKINDYLSFIKNQTKEDLNLMQKKIYELELSLKGLIRKDFWIELESLICKLGPN